MLKMFAPKMVIIFHTIEPTIVIGLLMIMQTEAMVDMTFQQISVGEVNAPGVLSDENVHLSEVTFKISQGSIPIFVFSEYGFFPEWVELVRRAQNDNILERSVVMGENSLALQELQEIVLINRDGVDVSYGLPVTSQLRFKVTKYMLQKLREAGVTDEVLEKLVKLEDHKFSKEEAFWEAVIGFFEGEEIEEYREVILASVSRENSPFMTSETTQQQLGYRSLGSQKNLESWKTMFYFPLIRKALAIKRKQSQERRKSYQVNEEKSSFNIIKMLKHWGIPKPSTLILIGIIIYLVLALLNRGQK